MVILAETHQIAQLFTHTKNFFWLKRREHLTLEKHPPSSLQEDMLWQHEWAKNLQNSTVQASFANSFSWVLSDTNSGS